jgi:hypothetical protein
MLGIVGIVCTPSARVGVPTVPCLEKIGRVCRCFACVFGIPAAAHSRSAPGRGHPRSWRRRRGSSSCQPPRRRLRDRLADALNGVMSRQVTAFRRVTDILNQTPEAVRATITHLLPGLTAAVANDASAVRLVRHLPPSAEDGHQLFPTTNCPPRCETCGTCTDAPLTELTTMFRQFTATGANLSA